MKKTSLLTIGLLVISIGFMNAQINKGGFKMGLSSDIFDLGYTKTKTNSDAGSEFNYKRFDFNLAPKVSYFVIDKLEVGIDINFGLRMTYYDEDSFNRTTTINAGPFVRYYIPTSKVLPFLELGGAFGSQGSFTTVNYGAGIGLAVPLGERVLADILARYHSQSRKDKDSSTGMTIITGGFGLNLGFAFLLGSN